MSEFDKVLAEALRTSPQMPAKSAADYAADREIESLWGDYREILLPMRRRGHELYDPSDTSSQILAKMKLLLVREGKL